MISHSMSVLWFPNAVSQKQRDTGADSIVRRCDIELSAQLDVATAVYAGCSIKVRITSSSPLCDDASLVVIFQVL